MVHMRCQIKKSFFLLEIISNYRMLLIKTNALARSNDLIHSIRAQPDMSYHLSTMLLTSFGSIKYLEVCLGRKKNV